MDQYNHKLFYFEGDKTVQCGRKVDVLKLWLMWKATGDSGLEQTTDTAFKNAEYVHRHFTGVTSHLTKRSYICFSCHLWQSLLYYRLSKDFALSPDKTSLTAIRKEGTISANFSAYSQPSLSRLRLSRRENLMTV